MLFFRSASLKLTLTTLLTLVAITAGSVVLLVPTAEAVPAHGTHIKYYSTAARTVQVGYRYYNCDGVLASQWGVTSPYSTSASYGCIEV